MVAPDPNGPGVLIVDLGTDRVWRCRLDAVSGRLTELMPAVEAPPGTGPRHLLRSADGAVLLVGELAAELSWYRQAPDGRLERLGGVTATTVEGVDYPSELTTGRDGRFVYVANRGPNTVSTFAWGDGKATLIAEVPTGGDWPRHIALFTDHLYVANERSHDVTIFRIDPETGIPHRQGDPISEASPTCLLRWLPGSNG
jgi:6-phosphogluconolactonase (cycloisomerase 2 family)